MRFERKTFYGLIMTGFQGTRGGHEKLYYIGVRGRKGRRWIKMRQATDSGGFSGCPEVFGINGFRAIAELKGIN